MKKVILILVYLIFLVEILWFSDIFLRNNHMNINEIVNWIVNNKSQSIPVILSSAISMSVAVIGWFIIYLLNSRQQKISLKNNAKIKIYEELSKLVKNYKEISIELSVSLNNFSPPFLRMEYVDKSIEKVQRNYEGIKIWQKYVEKLGKEITSFNTSYLEIWDYITYWDSAILGLKNMTKDLFWNRYGELIKNLWEFQRYLQSLSQKEFYWEQWDRKEINLKFEEINKKLIENIGYFDDFMTDVHNILVGEIFAHYKKKRENFANLPESYNVLTEKGIKKIENKKLP